MKLNKPQQRVVDHTGGPLLVVAGAGTGKTRVIVDKISALLDSGVEPAAILAVTFTEKAASEMLDRVLEARTGLLLDLPIMTFNGYGHSILKEFGVDIGLSASFTLLGEQSQIVFFRERIETFSLEYFLPLASSPDGIIADILKLISRLKQNLVTPEQYREYAQSLPDTDEAEKLERQKHLELAQVFDEYISVCRKENVIDYDDQLYLSVQLLERRPNIRKVMQNRYHTIFIDEFQDTNPMQSKLIDLLAKPGGELVVVGDDDQSIYGFRGATIQNILGFKERFANAKEVVLTENYRSHQAILDASYTLIQHNNPNRLEAELNIDKRLHAQAKGDVPQLRRFNETDSELAWIALDIKHRVATGKSQTIAVLTRSNPTAEAVHQALEQEGVEHQVVGASQDLYLQPAVRMLIECTRTINEPDNSASLHHTLTGELFNIDNALVAPLASKARYEHTPLWELLEQNDDSNIQSALSVLTELRSRATTLSIGQLLWRVVENTGYKDRLFEQAMDDDETALMAGVLNQFFKTLKEFERIALQPTAGQYLASLPALMAAGETTDNTLSMRDDFVTVTTVHKAKGLEWDTVYVPFLTEASFPMRPQGRGLQIPHELKAVEQSPADEHYAEERRVMYVALTRARENLIVSFSDSGKTGALKKPSRFIDEAFGAGSAAGTPITEVGKLQAQLEDQTQPTQPVKVPHSIYDGETVRLSVSQAQALLTCPRNFYYKFVLCAPEAPTTSTDYGSQLHDLFEQINKGVRDGALRSLDELKADLKLGWSKAGYSSKTQQERAFAQANTTLAQFYHESMSGPRPTLIEEPFEVQLPGNIILYGRMDVVFEDGDTAEIRDYKTGDSVKDAAKAKRKASESKQLTMYALAWQKLRGSTPKVALQFPDTAQYAVVTKQQKSLDTLEQKLIDAVEDLKQGVFPLGTSQHDYCIHPIKES